VLTFALHGLYFGVEKDRRYGFTALSAIISLLIIALVAFFAILYYQGQRSLESGDIGSPIQRVKNVQCLAQIKKIEMQIQVNGVQNGRYPGDLGKVKGLSESDLRCPVTGSHYLYNAKSGRVSCPDHIR
jgi:hypothetical protein